MRELIPRRAFLKAAGLGTVGVTVFGLTGCGGGSGSGGGASVDTGGNTGNGGNSGMGGNTGTGGDSGNGGNTGNNDSGSGEEQPGQYVSRTVKYFRRQGVLGTNKYARYYAQKMQREITEVCDGRRRALHGWIESGTQKIPDVKVFDYKTQRYYEYNSAMTRGNEPIDVVEITENYGITEGTVCSLNFISTYLEGNPPVKASPMTVNNVEYYCEKTSSGFGLYYYYCFEKSDVEGMNLKYVIHAWDGNSIDEIYEIRQVTSRFDMNLLRIPEGYQVMDEHLTLTGEVTAKDPYPND